MNQRTHENRPAHLATARGWHRAWVAVDAHPLAILTAVRAPEAQIDGLIAAVPGHDWGALDLREKAYDRIEATAEIAHPVDELHSIAIYSVPETRRVVPHGDSPILLSYLDVVLQGYLEAFGEDGARRFFETTENWDTPILNDRAQPRYSRAQSLSAKDIAWIDAELAARGLRAKA
ncbi:gamma-glutamylcyclotransferase [Roseivivax sp. CAU 1753]